MSSVRQKQGRREILSGGQQLLLFFAVVLGQGQQAFNSVTPRVRAEITVAAALADFACDFLLCQFEEPVEGFPSPSC